MFRQPIILGLVSLSSLFAVPLRADDVVDAKKALEAQGVRVFTAGDRKSVV